MSVLINADTSDGLKFTSDTSGEIKLQSAGTDTVTVDSSGNVGIGTSSPTISSGNGVHINGDTAGPSVLHMTTDNQGTTSSDGLDIKFGAGDASFWNYETGVMTFATSNTERMRIDSSGNVLVGETSSVFGKLHIGGTENHLSLNSNSRYTQLRFYNQGTVKAQLYDDNNGAGYFYVARGTGGVYLATNGTSWTSVSDERLKTDLKPIENAAEKVSTIRAVTGRYKTDEEEISRAFLIAQDVQNVLPEAVNVQEDDIGTLGIQYTDTIPLLVAAIKELKTENDTLKSQLSALETRIQALENA